MPVPRRAFYSVWIIPPVSLFPRLRLFSDQIRCISQQITVPAIPHIDITGIVVDSSNDSDVVGAWMGELRAAMSRLTPFKLELGKPIKLQGHERLSDNVSFPVPIIDSNYQALTDLVVEITHKWFPGTNKKSLSPFTDHMCIAENVPEHMKARVATEVAKFSSTISFDVDRIWMATIEEDRTLRDPFYFSTRILDEDVHTYVPEHG